MLLELSRPGIQSRGLGNKKAASGVSLRSWREILLGLLLLRPSTAYPNSCPLVRELGVHMPPLPVDISPFGFGSDTALGSDPRSGVCVSVTSQGCSVKTLLKCCCFVFQNYSLQASKIKILNATEPIGCSQVSALASASVRCQAELSWSTAIECPRRAWLSGSTQDLVCPELWLTREGSYCVSVSA